jgi:phage tail-like protein
MSLGRRQTRKSVLPDVRGLALDSARKHLAAAGFTELHEKLVDDYGAEDTVLTQEPLAGGFLPIDTPVHLSVNRASWARYLPSIYQNPAFDGAHLVGGILWIVQNVFASIERQLDHVEDLFDPTAAPEAFLPWLSSWLALGADIGWDERKRRSIIKDAARLYNARGSKGALADWIRHFTDLDVQVGDIEENAWPFDGLRIGESSRIGVGSMVVLPPNRAHSFVVRVPVTAADITDETLVRLYRIINEEKPAHTVYCLCFAEAEVEEQQDEILEIGADRIGVQGETRRPASLGEGAVPSAEE